ncbi:Os11g0118950, partial [Oryza sativa Japonica Group]
DLPPCRRQHRWLSSGPSLAWVTTSPYSNSSLETARAPVGVGLLEDDDAVEQSGRVTDAPAALGRHDAAALVHSDGGVAAAVEAGLLHVVHLRRLAWLACHGPRVEGIRRVVGAAVPVEERARHHHREPPRHLHHPLLVAVVAH